MKYGIFLLLSGVALCLLAVWQRGWQLLWLWPGLGMLWVALGYFHLGARVFAKSADGRLPWYSRLFNAPFLLCTWLSWHLTWALRREARHHHIIANLWLGRRPTAAELPPEIAVVVDLTSEFDEPRPVIHGRQYHCLPMLDGSFSNDFQRLEELCRQVAAFSEPVYIHCAMGHGRSAALLGMVLVRKGLVSDFATAVALMQAKRPGVHVNAQQRRIATSLLSR